MPPRMFSPLRKQFAATLKQRDKILTLVFAYLALLLVSQVAEKLISSTQHLVLLASMGASTIMLLAIPNSPMAQPYAFIMGHVSAATIGMLCANFIPNSSIAASFSVCLSLAFMFLFNCLHPPGGATALVPIITSAPQLDFDFLLYPVLINLLTLLAFAFICNRYILKREYPVSSTARTIVDHHSKDTSPLGRLGISSSDLHSALDGFNTYLDITEQDLAKIYTIAQANAYTRKFSQLRCRDIMSTDVKTVEFGTEIEDAWALLHFHKVSILPVIDPSRRVIGVLSLVDFLKRANLKTHHDFAERLVKFIRRSQDISTNNPEAVGQIMASPAFTVRDDEYIAGIVPLLSDRGLHHVPIIDKERRLVGIITQSDLISALYSGKLNKE